LRTTLTLTLKLRQLCYHIKTLTLNRYFYTNGVGITDETASFTGAGSITVLDYFSSSPLKILQIWEGGQSIQGGFIGGFVFGWLFYKLNPTSSSQEKKGFLGFWAVSDLMALVLPVGQAIGRWGNFFNIEEEYSMLNWSIKNNMIGDDSHLSEYGNETFANILSLKIKDFGFITKTNLL
jgi:hypothetical protein